MVQDVERKRASMSLMALEILFFRAAVQWAIEGVNVSLRRAREKSAFLCLVGETAGTVVSLDIERNR